HPTKLMCVRMQHLQRIRRSSILAVKSSAGLRSKVPVLKDHSRTRTRHNDTMGGIFLRSSPIGYGARAFISYRRRRAVGLLRKPTPLSENTSHHASDHDGRVLLQATEEQSQGNSQSQPGASRAR